VLALVKIVHAEEVLASPVDGERAKIGRDGGPRRGARRLCVRPRASAALGAGRGAATGRRERIRPPTFFTAAPPSSGRTRASAQPKKAQHGKDDDNHTNDPEDIVHSCLPSTGEVIRLTNTPKRLQRTLRRIIGQVAPNALVGPDITAFAVRAAH
jgi:hypothetical protein